MKTEIMKTQKNICLILFFNCLFFTYSTAHTALVYPTFLVAIADNIHPRQRAESIGVFRLWRDLGYAVGALLTGVLADQFGLLPALYVIGLITFISSLVLKIRMFCLPENKNLNTLDLRTHKV